MKCRLRGGGPLDGQVVDLDIDVQVYEHLSPWTTTPEPPVRRARKTYLYERDSTYRHQLHYVGEDVIYDDEEEDEEVTQDGPA